MISPLSSIWLGLKDVNLKRVKGLTAHLSERPRRKRLALAVQMIIPTSMLRHARGKVIMQRISSRR